MSFCDTCISVSMSAHYARRYMSSRRIHVQWSFRKFACAINKFRLVESWSLGTWSSGSRYITQRRPTNNSLWLYDVHVSAATGPCIQKSTFNQSEHVKQICRKAVGHVSFRWTCIALHSVVCWTKQQKSTRKNPKHSDTQKIAVITVKILNFRTPENLL